MAALLEYASPQPPRRRWYRHPALFAFLDLAAILFLASQIAFMFDMMITNINECGVAPYGVGSSANSRALGNGDFVRAYPNAAAWIHGARSGWWPVLSFPAMLANAVTFTAFSWFVAGYLVCRTFVTRRFRRVLIVVAAALMLATLPWIWETLLVFFD
jgi:hypothetical protein